jgi:hypothetical protein
MMPEKCTANLPKKGKPTAFLYGELRLVASPESNFQKEMKFPKTRVDLDEGGAFRLTAMTRHTVETKAVGSVTNGFDSDLATRRAEVDAEQKQKDKDKEHLRSKQARAALLIVVKSAKTKHTRAALRMAIPTGDGVDMVFASELSQLEQEQSSEELMELFKAFTKYDHSPVRKAALRGIDQRSEERLRNTAVFLEGAVLHGKPLAIVYAGEQRVIRNEGVSLLVDVPFNKALLASGVGINLGARSTPVRLGASWEYFKNGGRGKAGHSPYIAFGQGNLHKSGTKPTMGEELLFDMFDVTITRRSAMRNQVQFSGRMLYHPALGQNYPTAVDPNLRPPQQSLEFTGMVAPDSTIELQLSTPKEKPGTWTSAFGTPSLTIMDNTVVVELDPESYGKCPGKCGVKKVSVKGTAELKIQESGKTLKLVKSGTGHIDIENAAKSSFLIGPANSGFIMNVKSTLAKEYNRVKVSLPLSSKAISNDETAIVYEKFSFFNMDKIKDTASTMKLLGVELQGRPFAVESLAPMYVSTNSKKKKQPFRVKYTASYFGKLFKKTLKLNLASMVNSYKGDYVMKQGVAKCALDQVLHVGMRFNSVAQAKRKCDSIRTCKSFTWTAAPVENPKDKMAVFCSEDLFKVAKKTTNKANLLMQKRASTQTILGNNQLKGLVSEGMFTSIPKLFTKLFDEHAVKYGFQFKPKVVYKKNGAWLKIVVKPTKKGFMAVQKMMRTAFLGAVAHATIMPLHGYGFKQVLCEGCDEKNTVEQAVASRAHWVTDNLDEKMEFIKSEAENCVNEVSLLLGQKAKYKVNKLVAKSDAISQAQYEEYRKRYLQPKKRGKSFNKKEYEKENSLMKLQSITKDSLEKEIDAAAKKVQGMAESNVKAIQATTLKMIQKSSKAVITVAQVLEKRLPKLKSVSVSNVYLGCLYKPSTCDRTLVKTPTIRACFTQVGCVEKRDLPGMAELRTWLTFKAKELMALRLSELLVYKPVNVEIPMDMRAKNQGFSVQGKRVDARVPIAVENKIMKIKHPQGVNTALLKKFSEMAIEKVKRSDIAKHEMPKQFRKSGMVNKMIKNIKNPEAHAQADAQISKEVRTPKKKGVK